MDTTIFQKFYEEKTALINPTDCTKPIDNFPEVCISTFSKNIIDKFISLNSVQKNCRIIYSKWSKSGI